MNFEQDKKRSILGELLFPKIKALLKTDDQNAPKITGMLIDFEVFEVSDIIEFLESDEALLERVKEAEELISQQPWFWVYFIKYLIPILNPRFL